jgi:hypothetical protein
VVSVSERKQTLKLACSADTMSGDSTGKAMVLDNCYLKTEEPNRTMLRINTEAVNVAWHESQQIITTNCSQYIIRTSLYIIVVRTDFKLYK